jgi:hypothetical protein
MRSDLTYAFGFVSGPPEKEAYAVYVGNSSFGYQ